MTPTRGLFKITWFFLKWGLLVVLGGTVFALAYSYNRLDDAIRSHAEALFAKHYRDMAIRIRSAQYQPGEGISLHGLTIRPLDVPPDEPPLLEVERVDLPSSGTLDELLTGRFQADAVVLQHPRLRAIVYPDGTWSLSRLLPLPKLGPKPIPIRIDSGSIEIVDADRPRSSLTLRDIDLRFDPKKDATTGRDLRQITGSCTGDFANRITIEGNIDPESFRGFIGGSIEGLELSPESRAALPSSWAEKLAVLGTLRAQIVCGFRISFDREATPGVRFDVSGQIARGRIDDPRLPHPLTDIRGRFQCDNSQLRVEDLSAEGSRATVHIRQLIVPRYDLQNGFLLDASARNVTLHRQWLTLFPGDLSQVWEKFRPEGVINLDVHMNTLSETPQLSARLEALDTAFTYYRFPYRLSHAAGILDLQGNRLAIDLQTQATGGRPVRITGTILDPLTGPYGSVTVVGKNIVLDEQIVAAVPSMTAQNVVRSLHPQGTLDCILRITTQAPGQTPSKYLEADLHRCSLRYDRFPYPIGGITGKLVMQDDVWQFLDLSGSNDTGRITASGSLQQRTPGVWALDLRVQGRGIPLDAELRDALPGETTRQLWNDLRPQGAVDLDAVVRYQTGWPQAAVTFHAKPVEKTVSIEPVYFPYRFDAIQGELEYRQGQVSMPKLRAEHGDTVLEASAECRFTPQGAWTLTFDNLWLDDFRIDRSLLNALPERAATAFEQLQLKQPINVRGRFSLARGPDRNTPCRYDWDIEAALVQASLDCGVLFENVNGTIRLIGGWGPEGLLSDGLLRLDSATYDGIQLTQVRGPFRLLDDRVLFGYEVDPSVGPAGKGRLAEMPSHPSPVQADALGGTLYAAGQVLFSDPLRYALTLSLEQADLGRTVREAFRTPNRLKGQLSVAVSLQGTGRGIAGMSGYGNFQLKNADIYELPLMIALLKILSVQEVDRTAFSEADAKFRLAGSHIYLDELNFRGDAISLLGGGEVDREGNVRLTFRSMLGRNEVQIPIVRELFRGASEQIVLVRVGGTLQNPLVRREAFPGVNQALQMLQGGTTTTQRPRLGPPPRF
ncbi:hypothetical protein JCM19992_13680 [Thermostilla marina]